MSTPTIERPQQAVAPRRRLWYALSTAAVVAVMAVGSVVLFTGDEAQPDLATGTPVELGLGEGGGLASCLPVTADILADMPIAFEGTATAVDGEKVTLRVDTWYAGGEAATVNLHAPGGMQALIGGIDFLEGERYFVTATDGVVNYCGYTGPVTPELAAVFAQAFGN